MIKFNCIIHKKTGTVIKYEEWLKNFKENNHVRFTKINHYEEAATFTRPYETIELLTNDDFEIIYNSEFTVNELTDMNLAALSDELRYKISKTIFKKDDLRNKYRIEG